MINCIMGFMTCVEIRRMIAVAQKVGKSEIEVYCSKVLIPYKVVS